MVGGCRGERGAGGSEGGLSAPRTVGASAWLAQELGSHIAH